MTYIIYYLMYLYRDNIVIYVVYVFNKSKLVTIHYHGWVNDN